MLTGITWSSSNYVNYEYNADGLRVKKNVVKNGTATVTEYIWGENGLAGLVTGNNIVIVLYDVEGEPAGFTVNGIAYTYIKNIQGDVMQILDSNGSAVVTYSYDPWGVPTVTGNTTLAALNPCSYRGYDYDEETGYYYLQSRYYDPAVGRFLNADDSRMIGISGTPTSNNIYIYCRNSPVDNSDPTGYWAEKYYGFKWTSKGFNVYANTDFLSQWYCLSFADDILAQKGQWYGWVKRYRGMSRIRIAQEVWFHAVFYYVGSPVKTILSCLGVSWKWLNDNLERAKYIEVNYDDERSWVYAFAWQYYVLFAQVIKNV